MRSGPIESERLFWFVVAQRAPRAGAARADGAGAGHRDAEGPAEGVADAGAAEVLAAAPRAGEGGAAGPPAGGDDRASLTVEDTFRPCTLTTVFCCRRSRS